MMFTRTRVLVFFVFSALLLCVPATVTAQTYPHAIYGQVLVDGLPAAAGTHVSVFFDNDELATGAVEEGGLYRLVVPPGGPYSGGSITFTVNGQIADAALDLPLTGSRTIVDLSVWTAPSSAAPPAPTPASANGKYDTDGDGLIEVSNLEQLDAIRHDHNGDGESEGGFFSDPVAYAAAFPTSGREEVCRANCRGYELTRSLDFDEGGSYASGKVNSAWTTGEGWEPIGDANVPFRVEFIGNGHSITNLYINRGNSSSIGLFGMTRKGSRISQVGLESVSVSGGIFVGGLVGNNSAQIEETYVEGSVTGGDYAVGGLAGHNWGDITNSYASGSVTATGDAVGGLVGDVGDGQGATITSSFASSKVSGRSFVGGLIGQNGNTAIIVASYAMGSAAINGTGLNIGGLVGENNGRIIASYATVTVSGGSNAGGLAGKSVGDLIVASYWDTGPYGQGTGVGYGDASGAEGKTTAELQAPTSYTGIYATWDDTEAGDVWNFGTNRDYPTLKDLPRPPMPTATPMPPIGGYAANPDDVRSLKALYDATGGSNWNDSDGNNWLTPASLELWQGVELNTIGRVIGLSLGSNNLKGEIPAELGDLSELATLNLTGNGLSLSGEIPEELGLLSNLKELYLDGNGLEGEIPQELGNLAKLETLNLARNGLSGSIPPEIANLEELERLYLNNNNLSGKIPTNLTQLEHLTSLGLHNNKDDLGCIPPALKGAVYNVSWDVENNTFHIGRDNIPDFCAPPEHREERVALVALYNATGGQDTYDEVEWRKDQLIRWGNNGAKDVLVRCIDNFERRWQGGTLEPEPLWELYSSLSLLAKTLDQNDRPDCAIDGDNLVGTRNELHTLLVDPNNYAKYYGWPSEDNWLTDKHVGDWHGVTVDEETGHVIGLDLSGNNLYGRIPTELTDLRHLETLNLGGNFLSGKIPDLSSLTNLRYLDLSGNNLTGKIPWSLSNLTNLAEVNLSGNRLTGEIPDTLGWIVDDAPDLPWYRQDQPGMLTSLYLYDNPGLTGCIPRPLLPMLEGDRNEALKNANVAAKELDEELRQNVFWDVPLPARWERAWENWFLPTHGLWLPPCAPPAPDLPLEFGDTKYSHETHQTDKLALLAVRDHFVNSEEDKQRARGEFQDWNDNNLNPLVWRNLLGRLKDDCGVGAWHGVDTEAVNWWSGRTVHYDCRVVELHLNERELKGDVPKELGHLGRLRKLDLSRNCLTGEIPAALGHLASLRVLGLNIQGKENNSKGNGVDECDNAYSLSGELPPEIGNLSNLAQLNLFDNPELTGELPPEFGNLSQLEHLKLEHTGFTGCMPHNLVANFSDPLVVDVAASVLAFGATYGIVAKITAVTGGTGILSAKFAKFLANQAIKRVLKPVIALALGPLVRPGARHIVPWVGSELHNVELYCDTVSGEFQFETDEEDFGRVK